MRGGTRAYPGVCGHALAPTGMVGRARAYAGMGGYARVCVGARGCVRLWLGVFSNNYEFSEYLLETKVFMKWPLVRILYEFFLSIYHADSKYVIQISVTAWTPEIQADTPVSQIRLNLKISIPKGVVWS